MGTLKIVVGDPIADFCAGVLGAKTLVEKFCIAFPMRHPCHQAMTALRVNSWSGKIILLGPGSAVRIRRRPQAGWIIPVASP